MKKSIGIAIGLLCLLFAACDNHCYVPQKTALGIAFIDSATLKPYTVTELTLKGVGNDSILYNNVSASTVFIPLKQAAPQTDFEIAFKRNDPQATQQQYLLSVTYNAYPQLINPECGCVMFYELNSAACGNETEVLNVEIYNKNVENIQSDVHLKIYL